MEEDKILYPSILKSLITDNERISKKLDNLIDLNYENARKLDLLQDKVARLEGEELLNRKSEKERGEESNLIHEIKKWKDYINQKASAEQLSSVPEQLNSLQVKFNSIFKTGIIVNAILLIIVALLGAGIIEISCNTQSAKADTIQEENQ